MYKVLFEKEFEKKFEKLDKTIKVIVLKWIKKHLVNCKNPKSFGKALTHNLKNYWRYRIGDYRILVEIKEKELIVIMIDIEHRSSVYKKY